MITVQIETSIQFIDRLMRELKDDVQLGSISLGISGPLVVNGNQVIAFHFDDTFDSANEAYLRDTYLPAFIDVDNSADYEVKIMDYAIPGARSKDFWELDYKKELTIYLQKEEIFGNGAEKGLLVGVNYYSDLARQDKVLVFEREYGSDAFGNLTWKKTKRTWCMKNDMPHEDVKDKPGPYYYTDTGSRDATTRRRGTIIKILEADLIVLLSSAPGDAATNLQTGVDFLAEASHYIDRFYNSGSVQGITDFVNTAQTQTDFPFLLMEIATGYTVKQFIIDGVTY